LWTWSHRRRDGYRDRNVCDYILVQERSHFRSFQVKQPHFDSDHRLIQAKLYLQPKEEHRNYVSKRTKFPITSPINQQNKADEILKELMETVKSADVQKQSEDRKTSWISDETWQLIDQKASARKSGNDERAKEIAKELRRSLNRDRQRRMDKVAEEIESYLTADNPKEAYRKLQGWYKQRSGRPPKPTYRDEEITRKEYEKLFGAEEPPGEDIPIHIFPTPEIDDEPPTEQEIINALKKLRLGKAPGATGIRVEHLRTWMSGATRAKDQIYVGEWAMIKKLVEMAFTGEDIPSAFVVGILVLLPKPDGDFRGIALLEVIYKLISSIINQRLAKGINTKLHDAIHGF
jgi:hypothetical protein